MTPFPKPDEQAEAHPVLIEASVQDRAIQAQFQDAEIAALVASGKVVILKGVFDPQTMIALRDAAARWCKTTPPFPHGQSPSAQPTLNYHRVDDGRIVSSLPHIFHQICFNSLGELDGDMGDVARPVTELMRDLQNRIANTQFDFGLTGLRVKVLRYPAGGGYLSEHEHPREPQRLGLITSLSRIGDDFVSGGTTFRTPFGFVDTNKYHDIGDIIIFRYDLAHAVRPVDEEQAINWDSDAGKWSVLLELRETHGNSVAKM
jgi:hypothetical protein